MPEARRPPLEQAAASQVMARATDTRIERVDVEIDCMTETTSITRATRRGHAPAGCGRRDPDRDVRGEPSQAGLHAFAVLLQFR